MGLGSASRRLSDLGPPSAISDCFQSQVVLCRVRLFPPPPLRLALPLRLFPPAFGRAVSALLHVTLPRPLGYPLPPRPSSSFSLGARPGRAAILCEFLTAAGAGQLGHLGRADSRPISIARSLFSLIFFLTISLLALLFSPFPSLAPLRAARANYTQPPTSVRVPRVSGLGGPRVCACVAEGGLSSR